MASYNIELNSKPVKGSDEHKLLLRVTVNRKHSRLKTDHAIHSKHFNPNPKQNKYVRNSHKKHATINADIDDLIQKAKEAVKSLENEKKYISAESIKQRMIQVDYSSVIEFAKSVIHSMEQNNQVGSVKKYTTLVGRLEEYKKSDDLYFVELTHSFLEKFYVFLKSKGNSDTTASKYLETLRTIYNKATVDGITSQLANPFMNFKAKRDPVNKERLTEKEIKLVEDLDLSEGTLIWHVRNAFMFSFYCAGIRASDILQLNWNNIVDGRLVYQMHKTSRHHSLKLHERPIKILDLYGPGIPDAFIFPFLKNDVNYDDPTFRYNQLNAKTSLMNKYLGLIATKAGIEKKISTHTARHSFADIARQKTDNIYNLSKTLGHSSIKITEVYLASFDEKAVDDTMDEVFK
jgi:integrase